MAKGIDKKGVTTWIATTAQKLGYNHAYLASKTGISKFTIGSFLTGARAPRLDHLQKLCKVFGVEADDIAREYGYYPKPNRKHKSATYVAVAPNKEENTMPTTIVAEVPAQNENKEENTMPTTIVAEVPAQTTNPRNSGAHNYNPSNGLSKENRAKISKWIRTLIKESGLNLREYGELVGIKGNTLSAYTRGTSGPSEQRLQAICKLHGIDWKVAACYFGYHEYKVPEYWLGKDYKANNDWIKIHKVVNDEPSAAKVIAKQAIKPKADVAALKARIVELEKEKADILAEQDETDKRWKALAKEHAETELKLRGQIDDLKKKLDESVSSGEVEKYLLGLQHYIREVLPKAESVEVSCPGGAEITWRVKLPNMENAMMGHLSVDAFAKSIHKSIMDEVMTRYGLN